MACIELHVTGQNSLSHWKGRIWLPVAFKKFPDTPTKPAEAEPSFRKVSLPLAKLHLLFPTHFYFRNKSLPLTDPGLRPTI